MTAPDWEAIERYLETVTDRLTEAHRTGDSQLAAEAADELRLARRDIREMAAAGIVRPDVP
jgi:hypothetical protein